MTVSRRGFLGGLAAAGVRPVVARADAPPPLMLTAGTRTIEVDGKAARVFRLTGPSGQSGLTLAPETRFRVALTNRAGAPTIIHWHGQTPPVRQDGVSLTGLEALIASGATQGYDFTPLPGTFWMHSHHGLQEQTLMAAPLIVRDAATARADVQEIVLTLHDFTFRDPEAILAGLRGPQGGKPGGAMPMGSTGAGSMAMGGMTHSSMPMPMPMPMQAGGMDLNDVEFDAYLANDRTLADPAVIRVAKGGQVRLRIVNAAAATAFWLNLGALEGQVVAVDGDPVHPVPVRHFPLAEAQRADVLLRLPASGGAFPILAQREGGRHRTGIVLATAGAVVPRLLGLADAKAPPVDLSLEHRLRALVPLPARQAAPVQRVALTGTMAGYRWGIDGRDWTHRAPIEVAAGQRVVLDLVNRTAMAHPMHLHGHRFQVIGLGDRALAGALRDTVLVPVGGRVRIAFDADNPGRWLFHCHNLYHMASGMMTEVAYRGFTEGV